MSNVTQYCEPNNINFQHWIKKKNLIYFLFFWGGSTLATPVFFCRDGHTAKPSQVQATPIPTSPVRV